nr:hypothetical protein [Tanacetum cinerariifolium]
MIKECSSCGALYNKSCGCSKGGFVDKFVRNPNKTPDSSQRPPHNCPKCGNPVDGLYCRQCALSRKKLKEVWFIICDENEIFQDFLNTSELSNGNTNVVNVPQDPFVFNQDPGENSSQSPPHIDHHCCYGCGDSLDEEWAANINTQPMQYSVVHQPPQEETSVEILQDRENELAKNINTLSWNRRIVYYDDDDDDEYYTIAITPVLPTEEPKDSFIIGDEHLDSILEKESSKFIKSSVENLVLSPSESEDISDGEYDLHLYDDSPKNHLVTFSNPLFYIDNDFTSSDNELFSEEDLPMENFKIFYNPLFDLDGEIISTEVNPIQNEVLESITSILPGIDYFDAESNLIESFLNRNTSIDSTFKIDFLLDEFADFLKSIPSGIDEADFDSKGDISLIKRLLYVENSIELISPSPIPIEDSDSLKEEIDLFLTPVDSMPPGIENDDYDSEGDILFLKELPSNDSPSLSKNESFHFDVPSSSRPPAKQPNDDGIFFNDEPDTRLLTAKVVGDILECYVHVPNVLPTLCPAIDTLLPFLSDNEDQVHLLSHRGFKSFKLFSKIPMMIYGWNIPILDVPFLRFYPL